METLIGRIIIFCGTFAPNGWAFCDGSLLSIDENTALFALIGTTYGGDGVTTFGLPDLRGRVPVHTGGINNVQLGESGGNEIITLTSNNLPAHTHPVTIGVNTAAGEESNPTTILASSALAFSEDADAVLGGVTVAPAGQSNSIEIRNPYLGVNYIIALFGIFPSRA